MKKIIMSFLSIALLTSFVLGQSTQPDKSKFQKRQKGYYFTDILKGIKDFESPKKSTHKSFKVDLSNYDLPKSVDEFKSYWHNPPISQGNTGTCWDFSTTSFFESEVYRLTGKKVKLSEMWTSYWEYVAKVGGYVDSRGTTTLGEGSEANAVTRIYKEYGVVPEKDFTGMKPGQKFHNHAKMFKEILTYLHSVKKNNAWNKAEVVATTKSILNHYLGVPPTKVVVDGKTYTPKQYLNNYLKLNVDDYVDILSLEEQPFFEKVEYTVPDNWWHSKDYYNVPVKDFMEAIKNAAENGFSLVFGGDVSEPGKDAKRDVFVVPAFDIPSAYIDDNAREFRFNNRTTTDDHGIHMVGYTNKDGQDWYLIKDSGSSSRDGNNKGYYFFSGDYVKLKMMDIMVHKDAVKDLLKKFKK